MPIRISDRTKRLGAVVLAAMMFIGFGVLLFWTASSIHAELSEARAWPSTTGIVIRSDVRRSRNSDSGYTYRALVEYRYVVEGETYVSSRVSPGRMGTSSKNAAQGRVNAYRLGKRVKVYYNPDDPSIALLNYTRQNGNSVNFFFSIVFFAVGLFFVYVFIKETRTPGSLFKH